MIKVLHILSSLDGGGVEMMIKNYYDNLNDKTIVFDFAIHNAKKGILEDQLITMNSKIFHVTPKKKNFLKNIKELNNIIKNGNYDIVHCHQNFISWIPLLLAKMNGVKVRIVHSHGCNPPKKISKKIYNYISRKLIFLTANNYFACGIKAGKWLYGKKWKIDNDKNRIINNAINLDKFKFSIDKRKMLRKEFQLKDKICLLHVGRFSPEKNHIFMVQMMQYLPGDKYHLFFAGTGDLIDEIREYAKKLNVSEKITFLGVRKDINELLNMADILLLPSKNEGFPVTLVEAQAAGIKCLVSDVVSKEIELTDLITFLGINSNKEWINIIEKFEINENYRQDKFKEIKKNNFDIISESQKFAKLLHKMTNK